MKFLLLALVVCFVTINNFAHADDDDLDDSLSRRSLRRPQTPSDDDDVARSATKKDSKDDDDVIKGKVDPEKLSPEFIKKFDPDFTVKPKDAEKPAKRSLKCRECLKDIYVVRMTTCLSIVFNNGNFRRATVKNHMRTFLHKKLIVPWFVYIERAFHIPLTFYNIAKIVKCYVDQIPT